MFIRLSKLLRPSEVRELLEMAGVGKYVDGRRTAGRPLHGRKRTEQMAATPAQDKRIGQIVFGAIQRSEEFRSFALVKRAVIPRIQRYLEGMHYGRHIDNAIMGISNELRSDLSATIFLSGPDDYEGGELKLQTPYGVQSIKEGAGDAVLYATVLPHWIEPVLRGERVVLICWFQSHVRDPLQRQLLYEVKKLRDRLSAREPDSEEADAAADIHSNLSRMWYRG
jgi:PKHD-type hydroxylase